MYVRPGLPSKSLMCFCPSRRLHLSCLCLATPIPPPPPPPFFCLSYHNTCPAVSTVFALCTCACAWPFQTAAVGKLGKDAFGASRGILLSHECLLTNDQSKTGKLLSRKWLVKWNEMHWIIIINNIFIHLCLIQKSDNCVSNSVSAFSICLMNNVDRLI